MQKAILRLFNAVQIHHRVPGEKPRSVMERSIKNGYLLDPIIEPDAALLETIESVVGLSGEKANTAFHKSWTVVQDSPQEFLVIQQIMHYLTTYGFEQLGFYRQDAVYIPAEALNLPEIRADIPLVVIKALTAEEILSRIITLGSGIALAKETLGDIMSIVQTNAYDRSIIQQISNRELKGQLNSFYNIVPAEPVEYLRYLVSKLTGESLLIKNEYLINKLKKADGKLLDELLKDAPSDLASIFYRFKPLFLALKSVSDNKTFFNHLRKRAIKLHRPMPEDYMNAVTAQIKHRKLDFDVFRERVNKASTFRKIRLAYALSNRLQRGDSIVYRIRNGRGWATDFHWSDEWEGITRQTLDYVIAAIVNDLRSTVAGKTIYIPAKVNYALPATEKQFTGYFPSGSYITVPQDMIVGIYWTNTDKRVDLDFSVIGESGKIGWDAAYRTEERSVLFSGDMTDAPAPLGASELFYLKKGEHEARILIANYFNYETGDLVNAKFLVAHETPENFGKNYVVDVNNIIATANIQITRKQNILGLLVNIRGENRIYFANVSIGSSITSSPGGHSIKVRKYLVRSLLHSMDLGELLRKAGAIILCERPDGEFIDLSPQSLDKSTILDLISA